MCESRSKCESTPPRRSGPIVRADHFSCRGAASRNRGGAVSHARPGMAPARPQRHAQGCPVPAPIGAGTGHGDQDASFYLQRATRARAGTACPVSARTGEPIARTLAPVTTVRAGTPGNGAGTTTRPR